MFVEALLDGGLENADPVSVVEPLVRAEFQPVEEFDTFGYFVEFVEVDVSKEEADFDGGALLTRKLFSECLRYDMVVLQLGYL